MANLKSKVVLQEGEQLIYELEAELYATSANPFAKLIASIVKIFWMILGFSTRGFLVVTDRRVVEVSVQKVCWVFETAKVVKYIMPSSVREVGYTMEATCCGCFCKAYHLYYEAQTQRTAIMLSDARNEADALKYVDAFYNAISK